MAKLRIVHYPHPALKHPAVPVKLVDKQLRLTVGEMFERMYDAKGLGLAAPQVALPYRLLVMNTTGKAGDAAHEKVYINPQIVDRKGTMDGEEGCLSFPGLFVNVRRAKRVAIEAYDLDGNLVELEAEGLESRAWQHELDHLAGVVFTERFSTLSKLANSRAVRSFTNKFQQLQKLGDIPPDEEIHRMLAELSEQMSQSEPQTNPDEQMFAG